MSTTVAGGWPPSPANDPGIRKVLPVSYMVYNDSNDSKFHAVANGSSGASGADYTSTTLASAASAPQQALNALPSTGGRICFKAGSYDFGAGYTPPAGLPITLNATGLIIPSNVTIEGESPETTVLTTSTAVSGTNDNFAMLMNKNVATSDGFIHIRNLTISLPVPTTSGTGLVAWDDGILFNGAHDCIVENVHVKYGNIVFYPNTANVNTANALTQGNNYGNIVTKNLIENETGSSAFFQGTKCVFAFNRILNAWDDALLIGSAGKGHRIIGNYMDNTPVINGKGAFAGVIRLQNDSVVDATNGMTEISIIGNELLNGAGFNSGVQNGIYCLRSNNINIQGNIIHGNQGNGIQTEICNHIHYQGNIIFLNQGSGINPTMTIAGTAYDHNITNNTIFNNGTVGSQQQGINITPNASGRNFQDFTITGNMLFDDQGSTTQIGAVRLGLDGNLTNLTIVGNNMTRSTNTVTQAGAGTLANSIIKDNPGYNPSAVAGLLSIAQAYVKAGTPTDADFANPQNGIVVVDTSGNKIWTRTASATWKGVAIA